METVLSFYVMLLTFGCLTATRFDTNELQHLMHQVQRLSGNVQRFSIDVSPEKDSSLRSCSCQGDTCGCCVHMKAEAIHLDDTVCLNVSYLPQEIGVEVALVLDGRVLFSEKVSAKNPPPICADVPYLKKMASLCLRLYNLDYATSYFSGCAEIEARLVGVLVEKLNLGCFKFPFGSRIN